MYENVTFFTEVFVKEVVVPQINFSRALNFRNTAVTEIYDFDGFLRERQYLGQYLEFREKYPVICFLFEKYFNKLYPDIKEIIKLLSTIL